MKTKTQESQDILDLRESIIECSFNITSSISENKFDKSKLQMKYLNVLIDQLIKAKSNEQRD